MPEAFEKCVAGGGRVRTKKVNSSQFMRLCFKGGKSFAGEVKTKKVARAKAKPRNALHGVR